MSIGETMGPGSTTPMGAVAQEGIEALSYDQVVKFVRYERVILPLDGFAFWIRADLLNRSALLLPPFSLLSAPTLEEATFMAKGSLHYLTQQQQNADESFAYSRIIFTALEEVEDFNVASPSSIWIGEIDGVKFAFERRNSFYRQANLWHYEGDAVYPVMATQIIDNLADLNLRDAVVSNSLPLWLTLNSIAPVYPAFLVDENLQPPYISIHVESTRALAMAPLLDEVNNHSQLSLDRVTVTTYGLRNDQALDYVDLVNAYTLDTENMGIMGELPIVRDEHRGQNELNILAQKKRITYEVSYYQRRVRDEGRKFILSCVPLILPQEL